MERSAISVEPVRPCSSPDGGGAAPFHHWSTAINLKEEEEEEFQAVI